MDPTQTIDSSVFVFAVIFWAAIGATLGAIIGNTKGRAQDGALLGLFLGLIGVIIVAALPAKPASGPGAYRPGTSIVGWHADPTGRHQLRYFDGQRWWDDVLDNSVPGKDPAVMPNIRGGPQSPPPGT